MAEKNAKKSRQGHKSEANGEADIRPTVLHVITPIYRSIPFFCFLFFVFFHKTKMFVAISMKADNEHADKSFVGISRSIKCIFQSDSSAATTSKVSCANVASSAALSVAVSFCATCSVRENDLELRLDVRCFMNAPTAPM